MKSVQVTALRSSLGKALQEVARTRLPLAVRSRGETLAVIAPASRGGKPDLPLGALDEFVARHQIEALFLFGSILTDRFNDKSDVDVLIDTGKRMPTYFETCRMSDELEALFGRRVDLLLKSTVEREPNKKRRSAILDNARLIVRKQPS